MIVKADEAAHAVVRRRGVAPTGAMGRAQGCHMPPAAGCDVLGDVNTVRAQLLD